MALLQAVNNYFIKTDASKLSPEHRQNKDELRSYKLMHPKFAEKMQKVCYQSVPLFV
jgi:hypothetical protein